MKSSTVIAIIVLIIITLGISQLVKNVRPSTRVVVEEQIEQVEPIEPIEQTEERFEGTLSEVNTGCFYDAECYVVVDGKHVTILRGWSRDEVGQVIGSPDGIGGLESAIGQTLEVYAAKIDSSTYTLYGNEAYYVSLKK